MFQKTKQLHIFRSLTALVLALILALSAAPMAFAAESGTCGDGVEWSLVEGHLTISGKGNMTNFTDSNMPPWYSSAASITKISVDAGVRSIGSLAFYDCSNVTIVSLPEGLKRIGDRAFKDCTALPYLLFPSTLTTIGEAAFESCENLQGIRLPEGLKIIRDYAFYHCYALTTITVPASVVSLGMVVFAYCENLTQATLRCPIEKVPDGTFYGCEKLSSVVLPETVSATGEYAFHNCERLETIHYTGGAAEDVMDDIREDDSSISGGGVITTAPFEGTGGTSDMTINDAGTEIQTESIQTTENENSIITKEQSTKSEFTVNGEEATVEDVSNAKDEDKVEIESVTTTTITATITGSDGWEDLHKEINAEIDSTSGSSNSSSSEADRVDAIVRVPDTKVEGDDLANLAGKDVTVSIITPENDVWEIEGKTLTANTVSGNKYDFGMTITDEKPGKIGVDSEALFKLKFAKDVNFPVTVGVKVGHPYQIATLYEKNGGSYDELSTVIVDKSGIAWFTFNAISKKTDYYVGINVAEKSTQDAVIPKTLYNEYGLTDTTATLMDAEGNLYEITGNESSWGITAKQFGIYAGVAIALAVVIVTGTMFVINKFKRNKDKYRAMALADSEAADEDDDDDWEPIDEEALRLEIMRELLSEMENKK